MYSAVYLYRKDVLTPIVKFWEIALTRAHVCDSFPSIDFNFNCAQSRQSECAINHTFRKRMEKKLKQDKKMCPETTKDDYKTYLPLRRIFKVEPV